MQKKKFSQAQKIFIENDDTASWCSNTRLERTKLNIYKQAKLSPVVKKTCSALFSSPIRKRQFYHHPLNLSLKNVHESKFLKKNSWLYVGVFFLSPHYIPVLKKGESAELPLKSFMPSEES